MKINFTMTDQATFDQQVRSMNYKHKRYRMDDTTAEHLYMDRNANNSFVGLIRHNRIEVDGKKIWEKEYFVIDNSSK